MNAAGFDEIGVDLLQVSYGLAFFELSEECGRVW